jgi:hypothetical protein
MRWAETTRLAEWQGRTGPAAGGDAMQEQEDDDAVAGTPHKFSQTCRADPTSASVFLPAWLDSCFAFIPLGLTPALLSSSVWFIRLIIPLFQLIFSATIVFSLTINQPTMFFSSFVKLCRNRVSPQAINYL